MNGDGSGHQGKHPPVSVVKAAERAFREQREARVSVLGLVFDSFFDLGTPTRAPRILMFATDSFDLMLTVSMTPRGNRLGGLVLGLNDAVVRVRRPMRATIALLADPDGVLEQTTVPPGTASLVVSTQAGDSWQSRWLTL
jgi:hypothetical protein